MRYMLLIGSDDKNAPPRPRAEMEAVVAGHRRPEYRRALGLCDNPPERRFLAGRLQACLKEPPVRRPPSSRPPR